MANDKDLTVALDVTITTDLAKEGLAREVVNRVQNLRKTSDFNVTDRINISLLTSELMQEVIDAHGDYIKSETLADNIFLVENLEGEQIDLADGVSTVIKVERV